MPGSSPKDNKNIYNLLIVEINFVYVYLKHMCVKLINIQNYYHKITYKCNNNVFLYACSV